MDKINLNDPDAQSADIVAGNIEQLKALFPEAFTEGRIDFEVLKQLLGGELEEREEKYGLNWFGKRQARQLALTPSTGTLRPCPEESVDWDTTQNLMIEGDNLEVLKLLQKSYAGKVKLIYIDPPYNKDADVIYKDDFKDNIQNYQMLTGQIDSDGRKLTSNLESSGRKHTNWLNMMYPRLRIARDLLDDDGAIFCSIDDSEASRLTMMMDEIFGENNHLCTFSWKTDGNFDNQAKFKVCHEYIVAYARSVENFAHPPVVDPNTPQGSKLFKPVIRNTVVKNGPKNPVSKVVLPSGFPADFVAGVIAARKNAWPHYLEEAVIQDSKLVRAVSVESGWSSRDLLIEFIQNGFEAIEDKKGQSSSFIITQSGTIDCIKVRTDYQSHVISVLNGLGGSQKAGAVLAELGIVFPGYPKPIELIQFIMSMIFSQDGIVMDFFAGSGTTGHAAYTNNSVGNGNRSFILVQLQELLDKSDEKQKLAAEFCESLGVPSVISEITKERLRRSARKVREDHPMFVGDLGFRVYKLDSSNINAWDPDRDHMDQSLLDSIEHIKEGRSEADVLCELLLKLGLDICVPIGTRQFAGNNVYSVGAGSLFACLDAEITREEVEAVAQGIIAWHKELDPAGETSCVFRDSAFVDDVAKTNMAAILQQYGIVKVRSL